MTRLVNSRDGGAVQCIAAATILNSDPSVTSRIIVRLVLHATTSELRLPRIGP